MFVLLGTVATMLAVAASPASAIDDPDVTPVISGLGLDEPEGIAVDSTGNIYIADTRNDRVRKLNSSGTPVRLSETS